MLIDITQNKDSIDISYVEENGQLGIKTINFDNEVIIKDGERYVRQYHNFVECSDSDPNKNNILSSFYGKSLKTELSKKFDNHNINYFLGYEIPKFFPEIGKEINALRFPNVYSVDIEIDVTAKYGYSDEEKTENPIRSISFTDQNLNTLLFIVKNQNYPEFNDLDKGYIDSVLQDSLGNYFNEFDFNYNIKVFDTEIEMLNYFLDCYRNYFHFIIGWNFLKYDWRYISNRCEKLGLDIKRCSPNRKLNNKRIEINLANHISLKTPAHRVIIDYMQLFKDSLIYNNLGKYNLDSIAELILGLKKVTYSGNLRTLYETDYLRFVGYALVDTILVMLIHKNCNLLKTELFQSYYNGIPFQQISQNSISEALVYKELISDNLFLLKSEFSNLEPRPYIGGYVKTPTAKIVGSVSGYDFGSLYPNSMLTVGTSPEALIDEIEIDEKVGYPVKESEIKKWEKYKELGYCLSPMGRIYDVSKDFLFTRIEKKLLAERKIFKGHMFQLFKDIQILKENLYGKN